MRVCAARWGVRPNPFPGAKSKVTPPAIDALIAAIAGRQHGMITTAQLVHAGLGYSGIAKRAANGRLHRKYPGVYAVGQPRLSRAGEWMAAILACGPGACLACLSAAVHMRLWRRRVTGIDVLVPTRHRGPTGVRVHRCRRASSRARSSSTKPGAQARAASSRTASSLSPADPACPNRSSTPGPDLEVDFHWPQLTSSSRSTAPATPALAPNATTRNATHACEPPATPSSASPTTRSSGPEAVGASLLAATNDPES